MTVKSSATCFNVIAFVNTALKSFWILYREKGIPKEYPKRQS
jgi:hypothetical protein